ncbi:MAG: hybrid sensor histidine kinase/response regulator [Anaerolineales bacterium]|uniref:hybrid sensor histidine kinase/response regulator n=1 Tax=Candidatus Villigracilis affinis TaxID=3140682 RepID=UPI001D29A46F|nr:hybrid sensor histidine kinase/response regulator [Anaerolineales bacterium]MBK9601882.1 hybrid sensor histidine kinase/response regulator [Anaerolineales bacterium]
MNSKPLILIIDDDPALLMGVSATIKKHGFQVVSAEDGNDGFAKAKEVQPDLILSDVMMPPPNGFELRKLMSLDPQLASIPFIFLTARSRMDDKVNAIMDGADDYITKPFVVYELIARISAVLRRVKIAEENGRERAKVAAEADLDRVRQEILQNFHHEIRTPLSNIMMPLQLAINNKFDNAQEQSRFLSKALSSASRLESLTTDLILLSNIDQGNLNTIRQPIDVEMDIHVPINRRLERYCDKGLDFTMDIQVNGKIAAPRREFTHALGHLVDNACKFNSSHGKAHLRIVSQENGGVILDVFDNGPGIPTRLREKVFERFYQISQGDAREFEGMGVGLSIARAVFRSLRGDVNILDSTRGCHIQAVLPDLQPGDVTYG